MCLLYNIRCADLSAFCYSKGEVRRKSKKILGVVEKSFQKIWRIRNKLVLLHRLKKNNASLAQLVEQLTLNQWVQGSSP